MASETVTAEVVAEPVRPMPPELFGILEPHPTIKCAGFWSALLHHDPQQLNPWDRERKRNSWLIRIPAQVSAPAPAPDRRDELLREARWIIENTWTEFGVDRTSHQVKPRLDAFLAATAPAPPGEGVGR